MFRLAASQGETGTLEELLSAGVGVDCRGPAGETALILAAQSDQLDAVRWLAHRGAAIDARDSDGNTALMFAAALGSERTVMTLVELGADPAAQNRRGQDSLVLATVSEHAVIADFLRDRILEGRRKLGGERAARIGVEFSDLPPDKIGVFLAAIPAASILRQIFPKKALWAIAASPRRWKIQSL